MYIFNGKQNAVFTVGHPVFASGCQIAYHIDTITIIRNEYESIQNIYCLS
jgi:hypothetical protein